MNKNEVLKLFKMFKNTYTEFQKLIKDKESTKNTLDVWYECLRDLEYKDVEPAIYELIKTSKYIPTIAEIREKSGNIKHLSDGTYIKDGLHYMN